MALEKRFVADSMLGRLAKWLRALGFDTLCVRLQDQQQVSSYLALGYLLCTRHRRWCGQSGIYCVEANDPVEQLRELVAAIPIKQPEIHLLQRCIRCNSRLERVHPDQIVGHVPDYVFETHTVFNRCPACLRFYWPGSHPQRMAQWFQSALGWSLPGEHTGGER
jgi:uncharacterized protein